MIPTPLLEIHLVSDGEKRRPKKCLCSQACSHHFKNEIKVFLKSFHLDFCPVMCINYRSRGNYVEARILTIILNLTFFIWDNVIIPLTLKSSKEIDCYSSNGLFSLAFVKKSTD